MYTVKIDPDGQGDRLKARLVAKGYTHVMVSTIDTFSLVVKIVYVCLLNIYGCYAILAFVLVGHKKCLLT